MRNKVKNRNPVTMLHNMASKVQERRQAIALRRQGKSYREIMQKVPVSKGTLSKWFAHLPLTKKEEKFLKERSQVLQDKGRLKVAAQNHDRHEVRREKVRLNAKIDFERYKNDPLFLVGVSLYWAEGAKRGNYFSFMSSDVDMVKTMMVWMSHYLNAEPADIKYRLYIRQAYANEKCERYWSRECTIPKSQFQKTIYLQASQTFKKDSDYKGCLRMVVSGADQLLRIKTWHACLAEYMARQ